MSRTTVVYRPNDPNANEYGMVDKSLAAPLNAPEGAAYVISDEMPATRHMADNRYFTSKAKFRANTRAHGCIEFGNETKHLLKPRKPVPLDPGKRRDDIRRALWEVRNGRRIFEERN